MVEKIHKPPHLSFRQLTQLVVVTICCVCIGLISLLIIQARRQMNAVENLRDQGWHVSYDWQFDDEGWPLLDDDGFAIENFDPPEPQWIRNLIGVDYLHKVVEAELNNAKTSDLSTLSNLIHLKRIYYGGSTKEIDLSPLSKLKGLEGLAIENSQVNELSTIADLKNLKTLFLNNIQTSDLSHLSDLKKLEMLVLGGPKISNLTPLAGLKNLKTLILINMHISDLSPLSELTHLEIIDLDNIEAIDLSPLVEMKNLKKLILNDTPVSKKEIKKLKNALPNLVIEEHSN